jgi:RNA 2',3'-cyclic 3'-phosphodiesterase
MAGAAEQAALDRHRQRWRWPAGVRLSPVGGLHLTLHFLGATQPGDEARLRAAMADVRVEPMHLTLRDPLVWPGGIAVLQVQSNEALNALHAHLGAMLELIGLPVQDRPWVPHLTLARRATGAMPPAEPVNLNWRAISVSLVWSRPSAVGYQVLMEQAAGPL